MNSTPRSNLRGFTLIELLTVIAIIGILAAIIIPVVGKVRQSARQAGCQSNLRQIGQAFHLYAQDNKGLIPAVQQGGSLNPNPTNGFWMRELNPYVGREVPVGANPNNEISEFFACPTYFADNPDVGVWRRGYGMTSRPTRPLRAGTAPASAQTNRTLLSAWPEPTRNILVGEAARELINTSSAGIMTDALYGTPDRHGTRSNYLFVDGSVRSLDAVEAAEHLRWTQP